MEPWGEGGKYFRELPESKESLETTEAHEGEDNVVFGEASISGDRDEPPTATEGGSEGTEVTLEGGGREREGEDGGEGKEGLEEEEGVEEGDGRRGGETPEGRVGFERDAGAMGAGRKRRGRRQSRQNWKTGKREARASLTKSNAFMSSGRSSEREGSPVEEATRMEGDPSGQQGTCAAPATPPPTDAFRDPATDNPFTGGGSIGRARPRRSGTGSDSSEALSRSHKFKGGARKGPKRRSQPTKERLKEQREPQNLGNGIVSASHYF